MLILDAQRPLPAAILAAEDLCMSANPPANGQPVVLDTDIGTDIDDAYALLLAAVSPELRLLGVLTVNHDVTLRAKIARKLLNLLNRPHIPVLRGVGPSLTPGETRGWGGHEGQGVSLDDIAESDLGEDAPGWLARAAQEAFDRGQPLTLLTIGALTNVAVALEREPQKMSKIGRIVAMASNFQGYGQENARGEHNVACDPVAMERVIHSGIPLTLVGLNVTKQTAMHRTQVEEIAAHTSPLAQFLTGMHYEWFRFIQRDSSPMHDGLAVAFAFRPDLLETIPVVARVDYQAYEPGTIVYSPPLPDQVTRCRIATAVHADAYHILLRERTFQALFAASNRQQSEN
jgi:purine nucleosidase